MNTLIDLHTHSTASDGTDTPSELIARADKAGLAAIALTDHDTIAGLDEAEEASQNLDIEFIRGCELSVATDRGNIHLLGLWLPKNCDELKLFLKQLKKNRLTRNQQMIGKLQQHGINITLEEVMAIAKGVPGRPHMAALMLEKGYVASRAEAFADWLDKGGKVYIPKPSPTPAEALRLFKKLGASAIMAHPFLKYPPQSWLENIIKSMKQNGLFGLEAWHSVHSPEEAAIIRQLAEKFDLGLSGGSDYHGKNKPDIILGAPKSCMATPITVLSALKARRIAMNLPV